MPPPQTLYKIHKIKQEYLINRNYPNNE